MQGEFRIRENCRITGKNEVYSMKIDAPEIARTARAGQFLHIKCGGLTLRRPISIADMSKPEGSVQICYEVRGEGTKWLAERCIDEKIDVLGPIGNGFDIPDDGKIVMIAGGGIGVYPLYGVAKACGKNTVAVLGFRSAGLVTFEEEYRSLGVDLHIATDDGTRGRKGYTIDIVREILDSRKIDVIMTCGPKIMMKGIVEEAVKRGIRVQVSLEERMGCGVGACLACVCKVNGKFERVCVDGPVFEGSEVDFS